MVMDEMNEIYGKMQLDDIPWNIETPPALLVQQIASGNLLPCKVIDLGCGAGNYSRYLAGRGFDVTGVDISSEAIKVARARSEAERLDCRFISADLCSVLPENFPGGFDFALEWEVLHHIYPENRGKYVGNIHRLINPGGKYMAVCFNEHDRTFEGSGKFRKTRIGTLLYFSDENELRTLYSPYFKILELRVTEIKGKAGMNQVNYALLEKS
jgi:2-polyprenyl-3-methyl-5-hydroxy-6-metoxy-1,4-benzoquinol methylase